MIPGRKQVIYEIMNINMETFTNSDIMVSYFLIPPLCMIC